jgi:hypothetical protein
VKILYAAVAVTIVGISSPAAAQFTAAVVPPKPVPRVDTVARQDSIARAQVVLAKRMSDIKAWVDSAALALAAAPRPVPAESVVAPQVTPADTGQVTTVSPGEVEQETEGEGDTTFHNGARVPATATPLPGIVLVGAGMLLLGVALLRR